MEVTNIDIIKSFAQGQVNLPNTHGSLGNCASIALIKASIEVFGIDKVFEKEKLGEVYKITFKNNHQIQFTESELERSKLVAGFKLNNKVPAKLELYSSIYNYSNLALCAMVKRVMEIGEAGMGKGDFEKALLALNDGAVTSDLPEKLGLESHCLHLRNFNKSNGKGVIGWRGGHTVYISQRKRDDRGSPKSDLILFPRRMQIVPNPILN